MFNKLLSAILCLILALSLTACSISFKLPIDKNESNSPPLTNNSSDNTTTTPDKEPKPDTNPTPNTGSTPSKPQSSNTNTNSNVSNNSSVVEDNPVQDANDQNNNVSSPTIETPVTPDTHHTPLSKESYYQYSTLNDNEKKVYNDICTSIEATQNVIHLSKYGIDYNKMWLIYQKVVADNPQYFWVSKFIQYTHWNQNGKDKIVDLFLFYTDGEITDNLGSDGKLSSVASRDKISSQINAVNQKTEEILSTIPSGYTDVEKERLIHDRVLSQITYDHSAVGQQINRVNYSRVYDIYGALINKKSVCEGYSRLFQYLCYQVGINATIVNGTSDNQAHAWNAVKLDGDWYHIDTTWDDGSTSGIPLYDYFNLTTEEISLSHAIDNDNLSVPNATATKLSFTNTFGMKLKNLVSTPLNYQLAIDYAVKFKSPYIHIMVNNLNATHMYGNFLMVYVFNSNSDIQHYIKAKGYNLKFEEGSTPYTDTCIFVKCK